MRKIPMWRRYARLLGPDPAADVRDELHFHLETKVDDLIAQGLRPEAARKEAERQFGNLREVQNVGEQIGQEREAGIRRRGYWAEFAQDVRYAFRTLAKERGFSGIVLLILALGIAANTAVFSVVNTVLLRPLPFSQPDQLVWFTSDRAIAPEKRLAAGLSSVTYTVAAFEEFQRHNQSFQSMTGFNPFYGNSDFTLTGRGDAQPVGGVMVAENFFPTLGVTPHIGRLFAPEECVKGGRGATLLSYAFWQRHFNADPTIVGQSIVLSKRSYTVVGVLPATFDFGSVFAPALRMDVFVPAVFDEIRNWGNTLAVIGRLKPDVTLEAAQAEADILFPNLKAAHKEWWGDYRSSLSSLKEHVSGKLRRSLILLWCAVGMILLIVCVNLSNLQMARAAARNKELAVRSALGAGRWRLCRQLLTESMVLATFGSALGLLLAYFLTYYLARQDSIALPLLSSVTVDRTTLLWTVALGAVTALLSGIAPGLGLYGGNLQESLRSSGHGMTSGRVHEGLRALLVVSEVALACVLLTGAGLLLRSFLHVLDVDLGFQPSHASVVRIDYDDNNNPDRRGAVLQDILRNVTAIPGIEAAGVADMLPLGRNRSWGLRGKGEAYPKDAQLGAMVRIVTPGYLAAMGMRMKEGRDFSWSDTSKSEGAVIINEAAARRLWIGKNALGRVALVGRNEFHVIGILADVREQNIETPPEPEMYLMVTQAGPEGAELVVRSKLPNEMIAGSLMRTLRSLNPNQPKAEVRPLQHIVDRSVSPRRFFVLLVSIFAGLGLVLASLGIYGVISYSVTRQTQEIGIRMALGATRTTVQLGVIRRALKLALAGAAIGAIASFVVAKGIASLLFGTTPTDPAVFSAALVLLCGVALIAGYLPARRASRVEPMIALRNN